jgi:hypothetical protein
MGKPKYMLSEGERFALKEKQREKNRERYRLEQEKVKGLKVVPEDTTRKPISTQAGMKQRMAEFKEQLLHAPIATSVIRTVLEIARDPKHPGQMAALKMCMDRMLPVSMFEETKETGRVSIQVNISGLADSGNVIEGERVD